MTGERRMFYESINTIKMKEGIVQLSKRKARPQRTDLISQSTRVTRQTWKGR